MAKNLDREVDKGFDLSQWGEQMKFLHALQLQAQALIDLVQHACSLLGLMPSTYIESGKLLHAKGIFSKEEFKFYRAVVGFRNVLIHQYTSIDLKVVEKILKAKEYRRVLMLAEKVYRELEHRGLDP